MFTDAMSFTVNNKKCVCPPPAFIEIRESPDKGLGVFACKSFSEGEVVEVAPALLLPCREYEELEKTQLRNYYYYWDEEHWAVVFGFGSMYNHADEPNLRLNRRLPGRIIEFRAARYIMADEELYIDYGFPPI